MRGRRPGPRDGGSGGGGGGGGTHGGSTPIGDGQRMPARIETRPTTAGIARVRTRGSGVLTGCGVRRGIGAGGGVGRGSGGLRGRTRLRGGGGARRRLTGRRRGPFGARCGAAAPNGHCPAGIGDQVSAGDGPADGGAGPTNGGACPTNGGKDGTVGPGSVPRGGNTSGGTSVGVVGPRIAARPAARTSA